MLNNVPTAVMRAARMVTLRHPNAMDCTVYNKVVDRVATSAPFSEGGMPTIGGVAVLDSEDEADYSYEERGDGRLIFMGVFQTQGSNFTDDDAGLNYREDLVEALIEPEAEPGTPEHFTVDKSDIVTVFPGGGFAVSYEVVGVTGNVSVPPYTRKFILAPRQDESRGI